MKKVSFKVAKAIKEAGYDEVCEYGYCVVEGTPTLVKTEEEWERHPINNSDMYDFLVCTCQEVEGKDDCVAPTYLEVWLWLWREKVYINIFPDKKGAMFSIWDSDLYEIHENKIHYESPEAAIVAAIEYLVENDLIK